MNGPTVDAVPGSMDLDRRTALRSAVAAVAIGVAGCLGGDGRSGSDGTDADGGDDGTDDEAGTPRRTLGGSPAITSPAFDDGGTIPTRFTCEGEDVSPELRVDDVPDGASSLALLVDDPDAPSGTFTHWLVWDVPTSTGTVPEAVPQGETVDGLDGARQGTNDLGVVGYSGPCPPPDDGPHTYRFRLFAPAEPLDLEAGAGRAAFEDAVDEVASPEAVLRGSYER